MNTQLKKGVLELCVLSLLKSGDKYGYELAESISKEIAISEGTIYPILRRLRDEGCFEVYLRESSSGPPRKYYKITPHGLEIQEQLFSEWSKLTARVSNLIGGN
ncbi:MAG: PadR family transcriptional regulator [Clostridiales bacterium]|nr:PadR family transcriptional regulator [Clostridiales bacterium]